MGSVTLNFPNDFNNTNSRVSIKQLMNVIGHHFHLNDLVPVIILLFDDEVFETAINTIS